MTTDEGLGIDYYVLAMSQEEAERGEVAGVQLRRFRTPTEAYRQCYDNPISLGTGLTVWHVITYRGTLPTDKPVKAFQISRRPSMRKTTDTVKLASAIAGLQYTDLAVTLRNLTFQIAADAKLNEERRRTDLARALAKLAGCLDEAALEVSHVVDAYKPFAKADPASVRFLLVFPCTNCGAYKGEAYAPCGVCGFIPPR